MGLTQKGNEPPPRTGMQVFKLLPEGTLAELINDAIFMSPSPNYHHQEILSELFVQLRLHVKKNKLGTCLPAPMDVFLDERNVVQPDILVIMQENMLILTDDAKIKGSPDFIIEILSPGNKRHDTEKKKAVYEKFGVKEYFIIDPNDKETTTYYRLGAKFVKKETAKGTIKSIVLNKTFYF